MSGFPHGKLNTDPSIRGKGWLRVTKMLTNQSLIIILLLAFCIVLLYSFILNLNEWTKRCHFSKLVVLSDYFKSLGKQSCHHDADADGHYEGGEGLHGDAGGHGQGGRHSPPAVGRT